MSAHLCTDNGWVVQLLALADVRKVSHGLSAHTLHVVHVHPAGHTRSKVGDNQSMLFHYREGPWQQWGRRDKGAMCTLTEILLEPQENSIFWATSDRTSLGHT